jgi:hypothetical protein
MIFDLPCSSRPNLMYVAGSCDARKAHDCATHDVGWLDESTAAGNDRVLEGREQDPLR